MGYYQKKENGNNMGDQGTQDNVNPARLNPVENKGNAKGGKRGVTLKGMNAHDDSSFPKNGRGDAPSFKWQRDSEIAKGSI